MITWLEQYGKTHFFYIVLIVMGVVGFRAWLSEHDARLQSEQVVKVKEAEVATLQQKIVDINAAAAQQVKTVTKIVHDAQTPSQVVQAVPQLTEVPLQARVAPDMSNVIVDPQALITVLGQAKEDSINLKACEDTKALMGQQLIAKDDEIKALKKKPGFWHRVGRSMKTGVGGAVIFEIVKIVFTHKP